MVARNSHCSWCGNEFDETQPWPRVCTNCEHKSYLNPTPVAVLLVPVDDGLLAIQRGVAPRVGKIALPGGFINQGESWQEAGVREVFEETGIVLSAADVQDFTVCSAPDSTVLIFGIVPPLHASDLPVFVENSEVGKRLILDGPTELAFSLHTDAANRFFAERATKSGV